MNKDKLLALAEKWEAEAKELPFYGCNLIQCATELRAAIAEMERSNAPATFSHPQQGYTNFLQVQAADANTNTASKSSNASESTCNPDEAPKGYVAIKVKGPISGTCSKCALENQPIKCRDTPCTSGSRKDGCNVYFITKPRKKT